MGLVVLPLKLIRALLARVLPVVGRLLAAVAVRLGRALRWILVRITSLVARTVRRLARSVGRATGAFAARAWARLGRRGQFVAMGGAGLLVVAGLALGLSRIGSLLPGQAALPTPSAGATLSPGATPGPGATLSPGAVSAMVANVLPTPATTDTVLLVTNASSPSPTELRWLSDLRSRLGKVDPLAYKDASLERLRQYFVVFVIDRSADLDPAVLAAGYAAGLTIHLIGQAAAYQTQVAGTAR
jgi:hypothetical protein